jgi:hypothetical protein
MKRNLKKKAKQIWGGGGGGSSVAQNSLNMEQNVCILELHLQKEPKVTISFNSAL